MRILDVDWVMTEEKLTVASFFSVRTEATESKTVVSSATLLEVRDIRTT